MGNFKLTCLAGLMSIAMYGHAQITPVSQMENLGRGVVALPSSKTGILVSWRMLGTEDENRMTFDVLRDGEVSIVGVSDIGGNQEPEQVLLPQELNELITETIIAYYEKKSME